MVLCILRPFIGGDAVFQLARIVGFLVLLSAMASCAGTRELQLTPINVQPLPA